MNDETRDIDDTSTNIPVEYDTSEIERTVKLSNEVLQKAVMHANHSDADKTSTNVTTTFFTFNRTSVFSNIFEKKRNVEAEISSKVQETHIGIANEHAPRVDSGNLHRLEDAFEIIGKIGDGGQGIVYTAADRSLGRVVALKSLHKDLCKDKNAREHFISEAKITAQLDYPGIVPVYSLNDDADDGLHMAMKFINGETMADYLKNIRNQYSKDGVFQFDENSSIRKRLEIFLHVCDAIAYAHSRNVMHCDLKPENIMLGKYNDSYIMDWGISRLINDPMYDAEKWKKPNSVSGTPRYLSPEAVNGIYTDERADIYTLGLILFEIVFLKVAYNGKSTQEVIAKIKNNFMEKPVHAYGIAVDKDLKAIIAKATAFDRNSRYQSVTDMADDIRAYLANEETTARPDRFFGKIFRFAQHHIKMLLIFTLSCLLIGGSALAYSIYQRNSQVRFMLQREVALSEAYSNALQVANMIEMQMNHISSTLKILSSYMGFLMEKNIENELDGSKYFFVPQEEKNTDIAKDIVFSEACNRYVTLDRMSFNHSSGNLSPESERLIKQMHVLQNSFKEDLLYGDVFRFAASANDEEEAKKYFYENGSPILWFYCGFENGLYFNMPGFLNHPKDYDPRLRPWYIDGTRGKKAGDVIWGPARTGVISTQEARQEASAILRLFTQTKADTLNRPKKEERYGWQAEVTGKPE